MVDKSVLRRQASLKVLVNDTVYTQQEADEFTVCDLTVYFLGTVSVKTSILKDGHSFTVHVLDPKEAKKEEEKTNEENGDAQNAEEVEKAELETQEKDGPEF